jgi:hypothetical protein
MNTNHGLENRFFKNEKSINNFFNVISDGLITKTDSAYRKYAFIKDFYHCQSGVVMLVDYEGYQHILVVVIVVVEVIMHFADQIFYKIREATRLKI